MAAWVLSVVGVATVSVLCEVVLSDSKTKKYVRIACGIVVTFVLASPLLKIKLGDITAAANAQITVQTDYLEHFYGRRTELWLDGVMQAARENGYDVLDVNYSDGVIWVVTSENCCKENRDELTAFCQKAQKSAITDELKNAAVVVQKQST